MAKLDLAALIESLSRPEAYSHPVTDFEVHQTHISVVFLAGPFAYKIKKPVNLGFLDFSTLEKRKHYCDEEVRLNRRMAPHVYLGVTPITSEPDAPARVGPLTPGPSPLDERGEKNVIEWAVQMKRLPAEATLECRLERGAVTAEQIRVLAQRVAEFHRHAEANERIAAFGRFAVVAENARDNFTQAEALVGVTVTPAVFERLRALTETHLSRLRDLMETRAKASVPRDTHGDLHLDHVYLFPDEAPPNDLVIIDCIEFADRFRFADPIADMAFLVMDLAFHGRRDLARLLTDAYFEASGNEAGRGLLPYYSAYRAVIRAKVEGMKLGKPEIAPVEQQRAKQSARAHWLVALGELEAPTRKPALVLVAGLPGSGKSTIAHAIAGPGNFHVLRSDVVRKELAGVAETMEFNQGIYTDAWTERTYAEVLRRCEELLWHGERVLIDANFRDHKCRLPFFDAARRWGVPIVFIQCTTSPEVTHARLQARRNDASDADWRIYLQLAETWEPIGADWQRMSHTVDTSGSVSKNERRVVDILRTEGLMA